MTKTANATIYPPSSDPEVGKIRFSGGMEKTFLNVPFCHDGPVKARRA
ncbi:MAG: hypothetical protein FWD94_03935 [Treponema sp.]|nr:hypothetical protein [Treponema sp.]